MQKVYLFDKKGYFVGEDFDYGTGLPNNSVYEAPPEFEEGFIPHWNGTEWTQAENHKGKTVWEKDEGKEPKEKEWKEYGSLPENVSLSPPPKTEEEIKETRIQEIQSELSNIDTKSVRPTRSIEVKRADNKIKSLDVDAGLEDELATLSGLEAQALELRQELHVLENSTSIANQT